MNIHEGNGLRRIRGGELNPCPAEYFYVLYSFKLFLSCQPAAFQL